MQDRGKPILFSMARLDRVKNLTGLADMYGRCARLRAAANLVIVGGVLDPDAASDRSPPALLIEDIFLQIDTAYAQTWATTDRLPCPPPPPWLCCFLGGIEAMLVSACAD